MLDQSLLPPNATALDRAIETATTVPDDLKFDIGRVGRVADCQAELLPWLAWAMSVDNWDPTWSDEVKRTVIARSVEVHRRKGTPGALVSALAAVGIDTDLSEWFTYDGPPHTFRLDVDQDWLEGADRIADGAFVAEIDRIVQNVKPVRSTYALRLHGNARAPTGIAPGYFARQRVTGDLRPDVPVTSFTTTTVVSSGLWHMRVRGRTICTRSGRHPAFASFTLSPSM